MIRTLKELLKRENSASENVVPPVFESRINRALRKHTEEGRRWRGQQATLSKMCKVCFEKELGIRLKVIRGRAIQENRITGKVI